MSTVIQISVNFGKSYAKLVRFSSEDDRLCLSTFSNKLSILIISLNRFC